MSSPVEMLFKIGFYQHGRFAGRLLRLGLKRGVGSLSENASNESNEDVDPSDAIRDKSKLSPYLKGVQKGEASGLPFAHHYRKNYLRRYYGLHGRASGLNPGICFETADELSFKMEYESLAYPPLEETTSVVRRKREAELKERRDREALIEANMMKLPRLRKEMLSREAKKEAATAAEIAKKEEVIDEIRQLLGYNVNVRDPRFQEMLVKREEEERKKKKVARKEMKQRQLLSQLVDSAEVRKKEEPDEAEDTDDEGEGAGKKKKS